MSDPHHPLRAELERRIHEMEQHAEEHFGHFGRRDWILCIVLGVAVPVLLLWLIHP
jgi:hypothetical protein